MAPEYYYMWEFVTSMTIIVLVAAYIIHDKIKQRYESLGEEEKNQRTLRLSGATQLILGIFAVFGGIGWTIYMKTVKIYISPELEGFHNFVPPIVMGAIGLILLAAGSKKYLTKQS
jgi:Na+/proline symporter